MGLRQKKRKMQMIPSYFTNDITFWFVKQSIMIGLQWSLQYVILSKMVANKSSGIQLKCDDHKDKAQLVFKQLANDKMFSDVTLVSKDGKKCTAHRAIICYSSPYLHSILKEKLIEKIINLEVKIVHMKCMLEYIYLGETKVEVNEVNDFLNMGNKFQIRGLWLDEGFDDSDK